MTMDPAVYRTILTDVLAACEDAYSAVGAPDIPARRFIAHGQPVASGEQLTVSPLGISAAHPFPLAQLRAIKTTAIGSAGIAVEVWRQCWPSAEMTSPASKNLPNPAAFTAATLTLADDATTIWGHLADLCAGGGLVPSLPSIAVAEDTSISPMVPLGPTGLLAGWRLTIAVKLSVVGVQ